MKYYIYVLRSNTHNTRYVGVTDNITKRLKEHNNGRCRYTKGRIPWSVIFSEEYESLGEARKWELFLKSGQGRQWLNKNINNK